MKKTKSERKAFNFYRSYLEVYQELDDKNKKAFIEAVLNRQFYGIEPTDLPTMAKFAYLSQQHNIDAQVIGYEQKTNTKLTPPTKGVILGGRQGGSVGGSVQEKEKEKVQYSIDVIYNLYPNKCFNSNRSTSKSAKNKTQIKKLLKTKSEKELTDIINYYLKECEISKTYLKNFSTFLNNLPEIDDNPTPERKDMSKMEGLELLNYSKRLIGG